MMSFVGYGHTPLLKTVQKLATLANFSHWPQVVKRLGVKTANIQQIAAHLEQARKDNSGLL